MRVKLRDGFQNDTVTIRVNGRDVYREPGVTTDLTISFADAVDIPDEGLTARLEIQVANGPAGSKEIRVAETPFVDVWVFGREILLRESAVETPML